MKEIPNEIVNDFNSEILNLLKGHHCNGDIIIPLEKCLKKYNDVKSFCPDGRNFSYCCWFTNNIIFAYAVGMGNVFLLTQSGFPSTYKSRLKRQKNKKNRWLSIPYDSSNLSELLANSYNAAKEIE